VAVDGHAVVGLDGPMGQIPPVRWLQARTAERNIRVRSNSFTTLVSTLRAGLGVGVLPCLMGDGDPDLVRCFAPPAELRSEMWLIVRAEVRAAPHVRALADFLAAYVIGQRRRLAPGG
jgi:DNA-binding transcriptional LysR family regulator